MAKRTKHIDRNEVRLRIPDFDPRPYQLPLYYYLEEGGKRACIVWHRRAGKEMACWNWMIRQALTERVGTYVYFFPTTTLGKRILWDGANKLGRRFLDYIPPQLIDGQPNAQELKIKLYNGSIIQIVGTDNIINVGINPIGCVFSEYSLQNPKCWDYVRPILRENEGWAIFNFCVAKGTLIMSQEGLCPIENICQSRVEFTPLYKPIYGLGGFHEAESFYYGGYKKLLKISTRKGYTICCTPNHQLWNGTQWVRADAWAVGDYIPIQLNQQVFNANSFDISSWEKPRPKSRQGNWKELDKGFLNIDMFYLMGLYLAEGSKASRRFCGGGSITITNPEPEIIEFLKFMGFKIGSDGLHHIYCGTQLESFFEWFGLGGTAKNKRIPDKLLQCRREEIVAFLQGYFDGDGTAGKRDKGYIKVCSASHELISTLQVLLLNFGIVSRVSTATVKPTRRVKVECILHNLEIEGHFAWLFFERIGFRLPRKQDRRLLICDKVRAGRGDIVPIDVDKVGQTFPKAHITNPERLTYRMIERLYAKHATPYFKEVLNNGYYWDRVNLIEESEDEVFDFVIPDTNSFFTNGIISHNTPRGRNAAYELYEMAKGNSSWFTQLLTIEDTGILTPADIEEEVRAGMSRELIQQEFYCSFDVGQIGSYYGTYMADARKEGRLGHVPYDAHHLVYTAWDIGKGDATAIIFFQCVGHQINIIDYIEDHGYAVSHYANELRARPYQYGKHFMPHDAAHENYVNDWTPQRVLENLGFPVEIVPITLVEAGIERVRVCFPRIYIDEKKCDQLIKCLLEYRAKYDEQRMVYQKKPEHNWASHGADATRYMCQALENATVANRMTPEKLKQLKSQTGFR